MSADPSWSRLGARTPRTLYQMCVLSTLVKHIKMISNCVAVEAIANKAIADKDIANKDIFARAKKDCTYKNTTDKSLSSVEDTQRSPYA